MEILRRIFVIFLDLSLLVGPTRGQETIHKFGLEAQTGWIIPHNSELWDIASTRPLSLRICSQWMKTSFDPRILFGESFPVWKI